MLVEGFSFEIEKNTFNNSLLNFYIMYHLSNILCVTGENVEIEVRSDSLFQDWGIM